MKGNTFGCELPTSDKTFFFLFSFSSFFFIREAETERRRLVPETVVLVCNWLKPVARLVSVLESFLLPLLRALIGRVRTGLVDFCHLLNIPTVSVVLTS